MTALCVNLGVLETRSGDRHVKIRDFFQKQAGQVCPDIVFVQDTGDDKKKTHFVDDIKDDLHDSVIGSRYDFKENRDEDKNDSNHIGVFINKSKYDIVDIERVTFVCE